MSSKKTTALAVLLVVSAVGYLLACSQATWSPDGKQIAFVVMREQDKSFSLYAAPTDGGKGRLLWKSDSRISPPTWSPDGKTLAVINIARLEQDKEAPESKDLPRARDVSPSKGAVLADRVYLIDVTGGKRRLLAEQKFIGDRDMTTETSRPSEPFPQWAVGGKRILWPLQGLAQARLIDLKDGKLIRQWDGVVSALAISPSGKLAVTYEKGATEEEPTLLVLDLEKDKPLLKQEGTAEALGFQPGALPAWSPDSTRLVIGGKKKTAKGEAWGLWVVDVAGGLRKQILKDLSGSPLWVDWSPTGDLLAMSAIVGDEEKKKGGGSCGVWTLKPDGTALKRIDQPKSKEDQAYHPVFSPDGMRLTYRRVREGDKWLQTVIYRLAKGTEKVVPLEIPSPKPTASPEKKAPSSGPQAKPEGSGEKK